MDSEILNFIVRWGHLLFGIAWIGLLYYFNFIQGGYFKAASPEGLSDAKAKLAPEALWWFRWAAMFTFITGVLLLGMVHGNGLLNSYIVLGALMGTLMFLNVWLIIWPNQKIALGMVEGDGPTAGAKALLASRTNTLFSGPMAFGMLASSHFGYSADGLLSANGVSTGLFIGIGLIVLLELNAIFGKLGPMTTVKGVIHASLGLTAVMFAVLHYV
ncbi:MAG: antitermination protein NusG [Cellvibrionales bacterium]|nr:antitermination protein NusG [Cellvibrionales bacterium]MBT5923774.1 antitermination protein NusG [Cellvibrionales bacterium]MBT6579047.1 antitermination protein NusG [Cellvibrionales bacterium]